MIAITISNSIRVKPDCLFFIFPPMGVSSNELLCGVSAGYSQEARPLRSGSNSLTDKVKAESGGNRANEFCQWVAIPADISELDSGGVPESGDEEDRQAPGCCATQ